MPLKSLLADNGIQLHSNTKETADKHVPWGMRCTETPMGLKVSKVARASAAAKAGLSAHDVIIAIDGIKADNKQLALFNDASHDIECHLFRRDELMTVKVVPKVDTDESDGLDKVFPHSISLRLAKANTDDENKINELKTESAWLDVMNGAQS